MDNVKIAIEFDLGNDAFQPEPGPEIARILRELADKFEQGQLPSSAWDINGNTVATLKYE